jgi:hypothetical protein
MDRNVGLWIDHKQAYIIWCDSDKIDVVLSNLEPPAHFSGGTQLGGKMNQKGDLELRHNHRYKTEFQKALKRHKNMQDRLLKSEPADKMTMNQMIAHVRKFYRNLAVA